MRYLIVSDLHANREALEAVVKDSQGQYDRIICCGDVVGYGPDPKFATDWTTASAHVVVRGNHDRACCGMADLEWFNEIAQTAARWTKNKLNPAHLEWLRAMPQGPLVESGFQIAHGSPLDEDEYLLNLSDAANVFSYVEANLTFFGHTHLQGGFAWVNGRQLVIPRPEPDQSSIVFRLDRDGTYLVNPGSVGQPRDGDPRAAYALFDEATNEVALCRIAYDWDAVLGKVEKAGLPSVLGQRLAFGR